MILLQNRYVPTPASSLIYFRSFETAMSKCHNSSRNTTSYYSSNYKFYSFSVKVQIVNVVLSFYLNPGLGDGRCIETIDSCERVTEELQLDC